MNLLKKQKILMMLYRLARGSKKNLKFEDIVVTLFKKYPEEFQLKGYPQYPDSDLIRRPLYGLRNEGLLQASNMIFSFTDKGLDLAGRINSKVGKKKVNTTQLFDRYIENEIKRILHTNAYKLYVGDRVEEILDTDFFDYLGISVRADKTDFRNRLTVLNESSKKIQESGVAHLQNITHLHGFLKKKFKKEISFYLV